jgi:hypothetical protein
VIGVDVKWLSNVQQNFVFTDANIREDWFAIGPNVAKAFWVIYPN